MRKRYKIGLAILTFLLILACILGILKLNKKEKKEPTIKNEASIISNIVKFGYSLDDRDTKYMKETFKELETILNQENINYKEYAKNLAKLFVIDFYTLNNKINKYDVGSLEYILSDKKSMFKLKAMDTIYNDIIDNTYKDRVQKLPEITDVEVLDVIEDKIKLDDMEKDCYKVTMKYTYKEDLGYDTEGTAYLVKEGDKLAVAIYTPKIEE